ncbi:dienelactone hydrolase family protein [Methanolobus sp.]|uniref:dienelactone hydrolase family protein n=1 Tax=Methanolobus sp. TaxID=1874737 RepID=UPI0025E697E6|nr:dienelactone hydrolase family protein [Methanolobus sp.]
MRYSLLCLLMIVFVGLSGCFSDTNEIADDKIGSNESITSSTESKEFQVKGAEVEIVSGDLTYPAYVAAPETEYKKPAIVLLHSFRGMEPGYIELIDKLASEGYVVVAPEWQTFETSPHDAVVERLIRDSIDYLGTRSDVDTELLGLTGFCAGGRYTMLLLPEIKEFKSGVAWYGFPYSGDSEAQPDRPVDVIEELEVPMLMIHGTNDQASNISDIYRYSTELDAAGKYFELKVYQEQPHGFMLEDGQLSQSFEAEDAYWQMVTFFDRTLK